MAASGCRHFRSSSSGFRQSPSWWYPRCTCRACSDPSGPVQFSSHRWCQSGKCCIFAETVPCHEPRLQDPLRQTQFSSFLIPTILSAPIVRRSRRHKLAWQFPRAQESVSQVSPERLDNSKSIFAVYRGNCQFLSRQKVQVPLKHDWDFCTVGGLASSVIKVGHESGDHYPGLGSTARRISGADGRRLRSCCRALSIFVGSASNRRSTHFFGLDLPFSGPLE